MYIIRSLHLLICYGPYRVRSTTRVADLQAVLKGLASQEVMALSVAIQARIVSGEEGKADRKSGFAKVFESHPSQFESFRKAAGEFVAWLGSWLQLWGRCTT